jgi:tetratricopeptide (TPR) repeat protein
MGDATQGIRYYELYLKSDAAKPAERAEIEKRIAALSELRDRQRAQVKAAPPSQSELGAEARAFFERGVKLYRRGKYDAALVAFSAALSASGAPELHYNLAVTSERLRRPSDALDHFRAYLAARPNAEDRADIEARIAALRAKLP